jgi:hypothetical protein
MSCAIPSSASAALAHGRRPSTERGVDWGDQSGAPVRKVQSRSANQACTSPMRFSRIVPCPMRAASSADANRRFGKEYHGPFGTKGFLDAERALFARIRSALDPSAPLNPNVLPRLSGRCSSDDSTRAAAPAGERSPDTDLASGARHWAAGLCSGRLLRHEEQRTRPAHAQPRG